MNLETAGSAVAIPLASLHSDFPESLRSLREIPHILRSAMEVCFLQAVLM
jgi:hypothetical protein